MILTISGALGSGKSTIAKALARILGYKHYSTGDLMRSMAEERGMTLLELSKKAENDKSIDEELDARQVRLGKEEDNFVIDGRLSWHFIQHSVKIFLDVSDEVAANRIFKDQSRGVEKENLSLDKTLENIKTRRQSEIKRYQEYYGLNYYDKANYEVIVDTDPLDVKGVVEAVLVKLSELGRFEKNKILEALETLP